MIARALRAAELRGRDALDRLRGAHDPLVPPRRLQFVGDSDFRATGDEFLGHFRALADLRPDERVLDVGSGIGRMARPLAGFLTPPGAYDGFDVVPAGVEWCRRAYAGLPHFAFHVADVRNGLYRPDSGAAPEEYRFPFPDATFDFAFATSVFTHLLPAAAARYLDELGRVVRPGGRVLLTFFLLDDDARAARDAGRAAPAFTAADGPATTVAGGRPEDAVAYDPAWLAERLAAAGLDLRRPTHPGRWRGGPGTSLQDIVVADRRRQAPSASPSSARSSRPATAA